MATPSASSLRVRSLFQALVVLSTLAPHAVHAKTTTYTYNATAYSLPLTYQSGDIPIGTWISLLTLCLAPLIAHIVAGAPDPTILSPHRLPRWHDRIVHFNPTSILWRYFAITNRRVRAKTWDPADMAAANALFFTPGSRPVAGGRARAAVWDGSEDMAVASRGLAVRLPEHGRVELLSATMLKSVIVTLQGMGAFWVLVKGVVTDGGYATTLAVDSIFGPLAVCGLLRLLAALWLTDDYLYTYAEDHRRDGPQADGDRSTSLVKSESFAMVQPGSTPASMALLETGSGVEIADVKSTSRFLPANHWRSLLLRVTYLLPITTLWVICVLYIIPTSKSGDGIFTATTLALALFYLVVLSVTLLTCAVYFCTKRTSSTIIPCISAVWYKIYTGVLFATMALLVGIAAIETRGTACGKYTTFPWGTETAVCAGLYSISPDSTTDLFGLATWQNGTDLGDDGLAIDGPGQFLVVRFDGYCQGKAVSGLVASAVNGSAGG